MIGYCMTDKKKVELVKPGKVTLKNGREANVGTCPECGHRVFVFGKGDK
jgi:hypothetical protein